MERQIRMSLLDGRFGPGDRISLSSLAATLGTSVTPVREALSRLAAEHAFELIPGQIARVPLFDPVRYRELCDIRVAVEGLAAERAALNATKRDLAKLERCLTTFLAASKANELRKTMSVGRDFRFGVYAASKMPALVRVIEGLWLQCAPSFRLFYAFSSRDETLEVNYQRLYDALAAKNPKDARECVERIVTSGAARLMA
ncbi:GntR family transcriptional regulator [Agaricicola taiwanensis]|uniref:GntR family transcriptional regulator n=1 Tax=Agaricicola taiwanensis TaxID=591372 RepID=UPI00166B12CC|nr:GntR family transcriptional regulator [Agaricicola taiwanensis]